MRFLLAILVVVLLAAVVYLILAGRRRSAAAVEDARAEARRWYERLGGQIANLPSTDTDPAVRQALADASERYNAAGSELANGRTARDFERARESALEGLSYARAARTALGFDPGPDIPPLAAARTAGELTKPRSIEVQGHRFAAGPDPGPQTPYYYPGGVIGGRPVPRGWYSEPWWKTALATGAGVLGGLLIYDALFSPVWGDPGYDAGVAGAGDFGGDMGSDFETDGGGFDAGGGDFGGDFGGGDF
jgi:hypothetical protein